MAQISGTTIWRWLAEDAIKPWTHRSWISPRDPDFAAKAGRVLDLYGREFETGAVVALLGAAGGAVVYTVLTLLAGVGAIVWLVLLIVEHDRQIAGPVAIRAFLRSNDVLTRQRGRRCWRCRSCRGAMSGRGAQS